MRQQLFEAGISDPYRMVAVAWKYHDRSLALLTCSSYRLGLPGFLTSSELRVAGYRANNGLWDQRVALKWVKEFISGFGGDANNLTVIGQSAGGGE